MSHRFFAQQRDEHHGEQPVKVVSRIFFRRTLLDINNMNEYKRTLPQSRVEPRGHKPGVLSFHTRD